jgi:hypothetical protein
LRAAGTGFADTVFATVSGLALPALGAAAIRPAFLFGTLRLATALLADAVKIAGVVRWTGAADTVAAIRSAELALALGLASVFGAEVVLVAVVFSLALTTTAATSVIAAGLVVAVGQAGSVGVGLLVVRVVREAVLIQSGGTILSGFTVREKNRVRY